MTRAFHGQLLGVIALVAATVAACGGEPDQPSPSLTATPAPPATATATATATASPPPTTTPTTAPSPRATATASATPSPTPTPATPSPTAVAPGAATFRYDTYDTTGAVSTPGSYAFLSNPDDTSTAVTTYEALRDGTTTALLIHTSDADGLSRADGYDAVQVGDLFEWHQADDCFVRYKVSEVKPDPTGTVPRKLLAIEWMTYAFTGCSGAVSTDAALSMDFGPLPDLGGISLTVPVIHGPWQLVPQGWTGEVKGWHQRIDPPNYSFDDGSIFTGEIAPARQLPYWREPTLPSGWTFAGASSGGLTDPVYGYCAYYHNERGYSAVEICGAYVTSDYGAGEASWDDGLGVNETRVVAGRPALVSYSPVGPNHYENFPIGTTVYDTATGTVSSVLGDDPSLLGSNVDAVIAIAASLFTPAPPAASSATTPLAEPGTTTFRYDTYDTTGAIATPGSYAFLSSPDDTSTAVTTYEALRDGTTTALLIHKSDADGASLADVYDAVEAGDLFEWRQADDCFVRYKVTEVKPDPTGTVPRRLLAVEWMTYAFTGCSGAIPSHVSATLAWGELLDLGGTRLKVPIVHSIFQITPEDWDGPVEAVVDREPPQETRATPTYYDTIEEASNLPFWRTPTIPGGWILVAAGHGGKETPEYGYCSYWATEERDWHPPTRRWEAFDLCGYYAGASGLVRDASWNEGQMARETRVIAGRPAILLFSPPGPNHDQHAPLHVRVYDPPTRAVYWFVAWDYTLYGGNVEASLAIVTSLFADDGAEEDTPPDPAATTFRYDTYDTTGAVSTPGSYAFLSDPDDTSTAVTTYEALRDGTTTALLIHTSDADGASRAALYDAVEVGDLFEWRQADDCFVRYTVTEVRPDPVGTVPGKLLAVEWMTYAFTGCSGTVSIGDSAIMTWGELADFGGTNLRFPVVHGPFQLAPEGWVGTVEAVRSYDPPAYSLNSPVSTSDAIVARSLPYWREPTLPAGWTFSWASSGEISGPIYGYCALFATADGYAGVEVCGFYRTSSRAVIHSSRAQGRIAYETRVLAGRPGWVRYSPKGPEHSDVLSIRVAIYDEDTQSMYVILGRDGSLRGGNVDAVIAIAESLFEDAPGATTFRYDTYDTTGAVSTPGSYAFLADPDDTSTVVTTYEALRDGTATTLLVHTSDAHGLSRADVYDEVEAGDLFEWHKADDCFVRYRVTDVPEADATATHREFGVRWETYVFQGCQTGSLPTSATVKFTVAAELPLERLGGTSLTDFAVVHGAWEIYPSGTVAHEADVLVPEGTPAHVPDEFAVGDTLTNVTDARKFPYWREPTLPPGWRFHMLVVGGGRDLPPGYEAFFITAAGDHALQIRGEHVVVWPIPWEATWLTNVGERIVRELRTVADRPAVVMYSPDGPQEAELFWARVDIYDAATETVYTVIGSARMGGGPAAIERLLAIVRSLFESPNAP